MSIRSTFLFLLVDVFMLGGTSMALIYSIVRLHRFDWQWALLFVVFVLPVFSSSRLVYRQLRNNN